MLQLTLRDAESEILPREKRSIFIIFSLGSLAPRSFVARTNASLSLSLFLSQCGMQQVSALTSHVQDEAREICDAPPTKTRRSDRRCTGEKSMQKLDR